MDWPDHLQKINIINDICVHCAFFLHMGQLGAAIPKATSLPLIINQIKQQKYNNDFADQRLYNFQAF